MHLYFIARGVSHQMELWKGWMEHQTYDFPRKNLKTGEWETHTVQGALRPVQLYEYVFPKQALQDVLRNMELDKQSLPPYGLPPHLNKYAYLLKKLLGLKEIPKIEEGKKTRIMSTFGVNVHPLGIKEDVEKDYEMWGYHQEGL